MFSANAAVLDRPAGPALLGPPAINRPPLDPPTEATLAQASVSTPALADLLFNDIANPITPPSDDTEAPAAEPFKVDDLSKASWAASRIIDAQARIADRAELASRYKAKIDQWLSDSNAQDEASASYLALLLKPFVEEELARSHSRSRTLLLPTASASLRKAQDRVSILNEEAALAFLEEHHPMSVITKKTISLSTLRSLIFTEGEAVPGVEAEVGRDSLHLKQRT